MTFEKFEVSEDRSTHDHKNNHLECLFFGRSDDGCQCAVAAKAVQRIDSSSNQAGETLSLNLLGFLDAADFQTPRIIRVIAERQIVPLALQAAVTVRVVPLTELFPLPVRSFPDSIFSFLISSTAHGRALLLDPQRLLSFFYAHVDPFSPVSVPPQ